MASFHEFVIVGAGPTGLGAGYRLKELGKSDFLILEKSGAAGGLASSFEKDGFVWDNGSHIQFPYYKYVVETLDEIVGPGGWLEHTRSCWAQMKGRFVPYPVQNNIHHLPEQTAQRCLEGLVAARARGPGDRPHANFHEWILGIFGEPLAAEFMLPYNQKVWTYPPAEMAYQWIGERVSVPDPTELRARLVQGKDDTRWGPNHTFKFPARGGTGSLWKKLAEKIGHRYFEFDTEVIAIDHERKAITIRSEDGERIVRYGHLLSTIPLDITCRLAHPTLPSHLLEASRALFHSSSNIVGLGMKGKPSEEIRTMSWMYFPDDNCPFYRATVFSNYNPTLVPNPESNWSLMTEVSESPTKPVDQERLVESVIQGCLNARLIESRDDVVSVWRNRLEYGYPTPSLGRDAALSLLLPALDRLGIYSRGRFGAWKYEVSNQDHSMMQGVEWVNRVCLRVPETTVFFPNTANAGWGLGV